MIANYNFTAAERFLRYVQVDTQSDPLSDTHPTTAKQKNLSSMLAAELLQLGLKDAHMDEWGCVYATIAANTEKQVPVICFCSHIDTSSDCSGTHVKPLLHKNYQGQDITLPDDPTVVLRLTEHPYLQSKIGNDIITASGYTLLGADDKAGVSVIMDLAHYLLANPEVKHGEIKILFTPDEEVGLGTAKVDMQKLAADFGYTLDGGEAGSLEDETFSADAVRLTIHGVVVHPGIAKDILQNSLKIAADILAALPKDSLSPETTAGKDGFIHPVRVEGIAEKCTIDFIIRDFVTSGLQEKENYLKNIVEKIMLHYPKSSFDFRITEQYRNMKEVLDQHPQVVAYAREAINKTGLPIKMESIRGGTDGSKLSFMGLPCPNIFTGMQAIHSKLEHISVQDMEKSVETLIHLVQIWEEKS